MTRSMKSAILSVASAAALTLATSAGYAQTDDDDDDMSGGALAVLLLAVGGAVAADDLVPQIKASLDGKKVRSSDAQVRSLSRQAAAKLKTMSGAGQFTVCAKKGPCIRIVRKGE